jgi:GPH family glycoside/pentoside/hexuronide:cation symporter
MNKAELKLYAGYSVGAVAEAGYHQFITSFLLVFLTSVAGIDPGRAGTIALLTMLMDVAGTVFIGSYSDNLRSKYGRRRPLILFSCLILAVSFILYFVVTGGSPTVRFIYYLFAGMMFWLGYSFYYIPYAALGAEICTDYMGRIRLRSMSRLFSVVGSFMATVLPLNIIDFLTHRALDITSAWLVFVSAFTLVLTASILVTWRSTRGLEPTATNVPERKNPLLVFRDFAQIIRLKSMYLLLIFKLAFSVSFTFYSAAMMFFMQYKLHLSGTASSSLYLFYTIFGLAFTPLIMKLAVRFDKKGGILLTFFPVGVGGIVLAAIGVDSYLLAFIWNGLFTLANSSFWQLNNALFYDVTEVDEYVRGVRREGSITSLQSLLGTLAQAVSVQIAGALLKMSGFDAGLSIQPDSAIKGISNLFILYPSIAILVSAAIFCFYPMNRRRFEIVKNAMHSRQTNVPIDSESARILRKLI